MVNQRIKTFWENEINDLITALSVQPDEADWLDKLNALHKWVEIGDYAKGICRNIYTKAGQPVPAVIPAANKNYGVLVGNAFKDLELAWLDLVNVCQTKIGVDPEDTTLVAGANGNNVPKWKHDIDQKIPTSNNPTQQIKLTDIPNNEDLADLLYRNGLFQQITNAAGLNDILEGGLTGNDRPFVYGYRWTSRIHTGNLQSYKVAKNQVLNIQNDLRTIFGLAPADAVPNDWNTKLVKKSDLDTANATIATLTTKSNEYDRIHTKLNGKISDSELDTLF